MKKNVIIVIIDGGRVDTAMNSPIFTNLHASNHILSFGRLQYGGNSLFCSVRASAGKNETRYGRIHNCKEDGIAQIDKTDKVQQDHRF